MVPVSVEDGGVKEGVNGQEGEAYRMSEPSRKPLAKGLLSIFN